MFVATLSDHDGLLVDDEAVHLAAFGDVLAPLGIEVDEVTCLEQYIGFDDVGAFSAMLADAERGAPDSLIRALVEAKRPLEREKILVIEDSLAGVRAANAAGLSCAAVAHRYPDGALSEAGADLAAAHISLLSEDALATLAHGLHGA